MTISVWLPPVFDFCLRCVPPAVSNREHNRWIIPIHPDLGDGVRGDVSPGGCLQAESYSCRPQRDPIFFRTMRLLTNSDYSCILWLLLAFSFQVFSFFSPPPTPHPRSLTRVCILWLRFFNCEFSFLSTYPFMVERILVLGSVVSTSKAQIPEPSPGTPGTGV